MRPIAWTVVSITMLAAAPALAGTAAAKLSCSAGDFSLDGDVPGDEQMVSLTVRKGDDSVSLLDSVTNQQISVENWGKTGAKTVVDVDEGHREPQSTSGVFSLRVVGVKDNTEYFEITSTDKKLKAKRLKSGVEYEFLAKADLKLQLIGDGVEVHVKDVKCTWTFEGP